MHLIVLHRSLILQHNFSLVVQQLLVDAVARPRRPIAIQVHLRLGQNVLIPLQRSLCLQQRRLIGPRIDLDQRVPLMNKLPLAVLHRSDHPARLRGDRIRIHWRHYTQRVQIHADVSLGSRCNRRHRSGAG